jgi:hypothetical protein
LTKRREVIGVSPFEINGEAMMKRRSLIALTIICLSMAVTTPSYTQKINETLAIHRALDETNKVSNQLVEKVRTLLLREIEKGGFPSAVQVCSETAQEITQTFATKTRDLRNLSGLPWEHDRDKSKKPCITKSINSKTYSGRAG